MRNIIPIILAFIVFWETPPGVVGEDFTLPEIIPGTVVRKKFWNHPGYDRHKLARTDGPGLVITTPPGEETIAYYSRLRLSGRVMPETDLEIDSEPVPVEATGAFVHLLDLNPGENRISFRLENQRGESVHDLLIDRQKRRPHRPEYRPFPRRRAGKVIKPHTPIQLRPDRTRLLTLSAETEVTIAGEKGKFYRVILSANLSGWAKKENIELTGEKTGIRCPIGNVLIDGGERTARFSMPRPIPARVEYLSPDKLHVIFYNATIDTETVNLGDWEGSCRWEQVEDGRAVFILEGPLSCYRWRLEYREEGYVLSWKDRHRIPEETTVLVDPGHGGEESGAISPCGIEEKEINLMISRLIIRELRDRGIKAVLSRDEDTDLGIYRRTGIARNNRADILLSVHFNALPEDRDPRHLSGSSTFFYNAPSRPLAGMIEKALVGIGWNDNGVRWRSLAVIRPTDYIGVLVEIAYLTNPDDEARLFDPDFREKIAGAIATALAEYLQSSR